MESQLTYICSQDVKEEINQNVKEEKKERYSMVNEVIELTNLLFECSCLEKNKEEILMIGYCDTESLPKEVHDLWKQKNMFNAFQELFNGKFGSKIKELDEEYDKSYDEVLSCDREKVTTTPEEQKDIANKTIAEFANNKKFDQFYMDLYEIQEIAQEHGVFEKVGVHQPTAFKRFWFNFQYLMAQVRHMRIMTRLKNNGLDKLTLDKISEVLNPGNMKISRFGINVRGLTADMANELFKVGYRVIPRDNEPAKEEVIISKIEEENKFDTTYHENFVKEMLGIKKKEESKMETNKSNFEIEEDNEEDEKQEKEAENFENEFQKMLADIAHDETIPF